MAQFTLSNKAESDLQSIARYTVQNFGAKQAKTYGDEFHQCLLTIAESPRMGRDFGHIRLGLRRHDHKSHAIFYMERDEDVLIVRVLHGMRDSERHL